MIESWANAEPEVFGTLLVTPDPGSLSENVTIENSSVACQTYAAW